MKLQLSYNSLSQSKVIFTLVLIFLFLSPLLPAQGQNRLISDNNNFLKRETTRSDLLNIAEKVQHVSVNQKTSEDLIRMASRIERANDEELAAVAEAVGPYISELSAALDEYEALLDILREPGIENRSSSPDPFPEAPYPTGDRAATWDTLFSTGGLGSPSGGSGRSNVNLLFSVVCSEIDFQWDGTGWVLNESQINALPRSQREQYQVRFTQKNAVLLAELIRDILGRICDQSFFILGVGGDLSLACIVSDLAFHVTRVFEEFPAICDSLIDAAEIEGSYDRLGHLHGDIEGVQSSIENVGNDLANHDQSLASHDEAIFNELDGNLVTITGTIDSSTAAILGSVQAHDTKSKANLADHDTLIKNNLDLHDTNIKNLLTKHHADIQSILSANREFFLQTFIERALLREQGNGASSPPSVIYRIATLYLPEQFGGNLGKVREIVVTAINSIGDSGEQTNDALDLLTQGDQAAAGNLFKDAWDFYSAAYTEALNCPNSDRACR